jgi:hypothetical protein
MQGDLDRSPNIETDIGPLDVVIISTSPAKMSEISNAVSSMARND